MRQLFPARECPVCHRPTVHVVNVETERCLCCGSEAAPTRCWHWRQAEQQRRLALVLVSAAIIAAVALARAVVGP